MAARESLSTDRLILRPWTVDDADFVFDMYSRWEVQNETPLHPSGDTEIGWHFHPDNATCELFATATPRSNGCTAINAREPAGRGPTLPG